MAEDEEFLSHLRSLGIPDAPPDARRVGLDRNTEEGALVAFAGALDGRRPWHRLIAWVLLMSFGLPAVLLLVHLLGDVLGGLAG